MLSADFARNRDLLLERLRVGHSFDVLSRSIRFDASSGEKEAQLFFVDGMVSEDSLGGILSLLFSMKAAVPDTMADARSFADRVVPYGETDVTNDEGFLVTFVLSGGVGLLVEGFAEAILIDVRSFPARNVKEPENDRVLRGPREGFVESLITNTALLRRRLRDPNLTIERFQCGQRTRTDICLCYLCDKADAKLLNRLREKLRGIADVPALSMGFESLLEYTAPKQWWNPFPRARYTERPDSAAANLAEGQVVLLMDNYPAAMLLPTGIFDFMQDANDFYLPPVTGTYLRWLRFLASVLACVLTPLWFMLIQNPETMPGALQFLHFSDPIPMPLLLQFLLIEIVMGTLKLASLNTPSTLSNSFAVIGALVLGEFAVRIGLMVPEALLLMAFVTISNFSQPSFELGYALSFSRVLMLLGAAFLGWWGILGGGVLTLLAITFTRTLSGNNYWYPLIPCNPRALLSIFFRRPVREAQHQDKGRKRGGR
ncbi:MAG: spore germination protein [Oscillospiraceae bacterium]|jgi:stage V sporulation protein AF|nr:spore germination protein [Oscillospiraceae bacterium]